MIYKDTIANMQIMPLYGVIEQQNKYIFYIKIQTILIEYNTFQTGHVIILAGYVMTVTRSRQVQKQCPPKMPRNPIQVLVTIRY